jgi:hypothetical protein
LILPKFSMVFSVKLNPPVGSQTPLTKPPVPFGTLSTVRLQTVSSVRSMSARVTGRRERLVEDVEQTHAELELLLAAEREVLEQRQVVVLPGRRPQVVRRQHLARLAERREADAVDVEHLLALARAAEPRVAGVDRARGRCPVHLGPSGMMSGVP